MIYTPIIKIQVLMSKQRLVSQMTFRKHPKIKFSVPIRACKKLLIRNISWISIMQP